MCWIAAAGVVLVASLVRMLMVGLVGAIVKGTFIIAVIGSPAPAGCAARHDRSFIMSMV